MTELKATNVLIAVLLVALIVGVMITFVARGSAEYGTTFDEENYEVYNSLEEINNITKEIQDKSDNIGTRSGALDILGGFFSDAYQSLKLTKSSFNVLEDMTNEGTEDLGLGTNTALFKAVITTIVLVMIILGIIIAAIIKRSL